MVFITSYSVTHTLTTLDAGIHTVPENIDITAKLIVNTNPCVNCMIDLLVFVSCHHDLSSSTGESAMDQPLHFFHTIK